MDPNAVLRPVGPEQPGVYWRRRALLLAVVAVAVVLLAWGCTGGWGGRPTARATGTATPSLQPTSPVTTTPGRSALPACRPEQLKVTGATDATTYGAGATPRLSATLTNVGDHPCRFDSSPSARNWTILSGSDRVWSTADCPQSHLVASARLRRGRSVTYAVTWDRHRSTRGCASPGAVAHAGTYRLYVTVDRITSAAAVFRLG